MIEENEEEAKPTLQAKLADARSRSAEGRDAGMPHSVATKCPERQDRETERQTRDRQREDYRERGREYREETERDKK